MDDAPTSWTAHFPALAALEPPVRDQLHLARPAALPADARVFGPGDPCRNYILVLSGSVRVQMLAENGREIVLFRIGPGETCILTTAGLLAGDAYAAEAMTESAVEAVMLPAPVFHDLLARSAPFRDFVFRAFGTRFGELMMLIQEIAFQRIDVRLARHLLDRAEGGTVAATHQALAVELGTAREVVSRQLKEFERRGLVALDRGLVRLVRAPALRALADTAGDGD